jgi:hypothetical protein
MSVSSHSHLTGTSLPAQELLQSMKDMLEKAPDLNVGLKEAHQSGKLTDREALFNIINSLEGAEYLTVYRMIRPLGFTPSLMNDSERDEKEKKRVATFFSRLFDQPQPLLDALLSEG